MGWARDYTHTHTHTKEARRICNHVDLVKLGLPKITAYRHKCRDPQKSLMAMLYSLHYSCVYILRLVCNNYGFAREHIH